MTGLQILTRGCLAAATAGALLTTALASARAEVRFLDHRGKVIVLESPPQKIVSMFASGPLVYYAVDGKSDHIAGVNIKGVKMYRDSIYAELIPEFLKLNTNVAGEGFAPNVEAILEIKPDVVFQWVFDPKIIEPLERVGLSPPAVGPAATALTPAGQAVESTICLAAVGATPRGRPLGPSRGTRAPTRRRP